LRQRKSDIHQLANLGDLGRGLEVAERVLAHFPRLNALPGHLKAGSADIALTLTNLVAKGFPSDWDEQWQKLGFAAEA
jgi:hypothetical protein